MKKRFFSFPLVTLLFLGSLIIGSSIKKDPYVIKEIKNEKSVNPMATSFKISKYPSHNHILATLFWVGEDESEENDYTANKSSAWDKNWLNNFGGIDTPYSRNGYFPKAFKPKENPFYIALPYNDLDSNGRKESAVNIPWYDPNLGDSHSFLKNRWVSITYKENICFAQIEDVGPFEDDDFSYVFENARPKQKVGIDLSPALKTCLKMANNDFVDWQFIDELSVPNGPWKEIVTTSQLNW